MEDNNIHTSVVIEVANAQGEPEEKKSYQIEIDDINTPKDYVIDQIFCGENVTVYALFEAPENESKNLVEVPSTNIGDDYKFYYKNSFKRITNEKKLNRIKQNSPVLSSEENIKFFSHVTSRKESLYCLKHPSGNYDLMVPERKKSDLKVLYSKDLPLIKSTSTKFKAISVGVNTDIVQSPKIIDEVQKMLGVNVPPLRYKDKSFETTNSSSVPSNDVTEIEVRQSFSSLGSMDGKNPNGKSMPNIFFVPVLMMEDENSKKFLKDDIHRIPEKDFKALTSNLSVGVNTDDELNTKSKRFIPDFENSKNVCHFPEFQLVDQSFNEKLRQGEKRTILKEIKIMQLKLNALIKNIESNNFYLDAKDNDLELDTNTILEETESLESGESENLESPKKFLQDSLKLTENEKEKLDDQLTLLPLAYPLDEKKSATNLENEAQDIEKDEITLSKTDSVFLEEDLHVPEMSEDFERLELKKVLSCCDMLEKSLESPKKFGLSKSDANLILKKKHNSVKKSSSLDMKSFKTEVLKILRNCSFKKEGNLKPNLNLRIIKNSEAQLGDNESLLKTEIKDVTNKKTNSKTNLLNFPQENKKGEKLNLNKLGSTVEKNQHEEKGDAQSVTNNKTLPPTTLAKQQVSALGAKVYASDAALSPNKSFCSCKKESTPPDKTLESEKKTSSDSEKPPTPNGNLRKIITANSNMKKDSKLNKKTNNHKASELPTPKVEMSNKKIVANSRKLGKNNAVSKLHIDKLMKNDNISNYKTSQIFKGNTDEKPGSKGDKCHRPPSQKLENKENPVEVPTAVNKETDIKLSKKKSPVSLQVETTTKKNSNPKPKIEAVLENIEEVSPNTTPQKKPADTSSVVVELLSKKPKSMKNIYSEFDQGKMNLEKNSNKADSNGTIKRSRDHSEVNEKSESLGKPIVKSVWALTKVLLFEDGTKKLEVLEASLTPPGYSLNQSVNTSK